MYKIEIEAFFMKPIHSLFYQKLDVFFVNFLET